MIDSVLTLGWPLLALLGDSGGSWVVHYCCSGTHDDCIVSVKLLVRIVRTYVMRRVYGIFKVTVINVRAKNRLRQGCQRRRY